MNSPLNHEWEEGLDIDNFDLRLILVVRPNNNPHIGPEITTTTQTLISSQNNQVDNYVMMPIRIIPGPAGIVQMAKLCKLVDTREGGEESNGKLEKVVAVIKSCTLSALGDLTITLKDLSGTIFGTIYFKVLTAKRFTKAITIGAALILHNVSVFSLMQSTYHYLNITKKNMVKVFHKYGGSA
nr:hypothetical protein [Tanacetum cinerariifolium]